MYYILFYTKVQKVVQKELQAGKLNREDVMDCSR